MIETHEHAGDPHVFHRAFERRFGIRPTDYLGEVVATRTISSEKKRTNVTFNGSDHSSPNPVEQS
jgi:hypothetical protein